MKSIPQLTVLLIFLFIWCYQAISQTKHRDGKILEGESWLPFSYPDKADFYVSTTGNDSWSGTLEAPNSAGTDGPFRTLARAQKAVRELKQQVYKPKDEPVEKRWIGTPHPLGKGKDILVYLREGYYPLPQPLVFEPADGGERVETNLPTGAFEYHKLKDHYVTYAAYPGEKPVITGGVQVTNWKKSGNFWVAPFRADSAQMLVVNGKRQILARTPNEGYFIPPAISENTSFLYFNKGDIKNWKEKEDNRVIMLLRWHTGINKIVNIDEKKGIATFKQPQEGVVIVPPRYYVENVKELLDAPGEWFFDKKTKEIYLIPENGIENPLTISAEVPVLSNLISVKGTLGKPVRNLRFYGLTFEGVTQNESALVYEFAHACEVSGSEIRSCSGRGISIEKGCYQTRIFENKFETLDNGGIYVHGPGIPQDGREITRETLISKNRFYDCGGINIYANYTLLTTISHNYLTKTRGRYGISVGGWANIEEAIDGGYVIEYNHLDNVQKDADDSGAIKTAGITFNSVVRRNLIHDVKAGFFNDNVGFWFDNMSSGWISEENIYYNLEQGEMKYCAAMPEDNIYRNNFRIEAPQNAPETIITGVPVFETKNLKIDAPGNPSGSIPSGSVIKVSADVKNTGSSGIAPVEMYLDGKVYQQKPFAVIKNNERKIEFEIRIYDPGNHQVAIGSTPYSNFTIAGAKPDVVFEDFKISGDRLLKGEFIKASAKAINLFDGDKKTEIRLFSDNNAVASQSIELKKNESKEITFDFMPGVGVHSLRIENSSERNITVSDFTVVDLSKTEIHEYCSVKAKPFEIESDKKANRFKITAGGSDFYHAEDSYAAAYIKGIKGDFVATVKISAFGNRTHEWFRTGLFVRNDMAQSFDVLPGSKGSVLVFATPGRAGIEYDEFANGCMHKASSTNLPENSKTPIYLKMVRHGNSFSGYISLDGTNWIIERHSTDIPGINNAIDIGLAAGGPDKRQYWVEFTDWKIQVAK